MLPEMEPESPTEIKAVNSAEQFFGTLLMKGNACPVEAVDWTKEAIVTGKVVSTSCLWKQSESEDCMRSTWICNLKEMFTFCDGVRRTLRLIFANENAEIAAKIDLHKNSYVAVKNSKLIRNSILEGDSSNVTVFIDSQKFNSINDIYYKRRYNDSWICLTNCSTSQNSPTKDCDSDEDVFVINQNALNNLKQQMSSTSKESDKTSVVDSTKTQASPSKIHSNTNADSESARKQVAEPSSDVNQNIQIKGSNVKKRVTFNVESLEEKTRSSRCSPIFTQSEIGLSNNQGVAERPLNSEYSVTGDFLSSDSNLTVIKPLNAIPARLNSVRQGWVVNLFGILTKILKNPSVTIENTYHTAITIIDQTQSNEFKVHILYSENEPPPTFRQYDILRFNNMKIEKTHGGILQGRIYSSCNVISFSRENPEIYFRQRRGDSEDTAYLPSSEDMEKIQELREWMFENIPSARVFTSLSNLEKKTGTVHLSCQIVKKKIFSNGVIILRVRDGTICTKPIFRYPLDEHNDWGKVQAAAEYIYSTDDIDICITNTDRKMIRKAESLKENDFVELFNVNISLYSGLHKTIKKFAIRAYLKGEAQNLKIINTAEENSFSESTDEQSVHSSLSDSTSDVSDNDDNIKIDSNVKERKKRKLFNPDSIDIEVQGDDNSPKIKTKKIVDSKDMNMNENIPINEEVIQREQFETSILKIRLPRLENIDALSNFKKNEEQSNDRITRSKSAERNLNNSITKALDTKKQRIHESPQPIIEIDKGSSTSNGNDASDNTSDDVHRSCVEDILFHAIMNIFPDENDTSEHQTSEKRAVVQVSDQEGDVAGTTADNYLTKWPSQDRTEAFFIRVYIVNTIPVIHEKSSVFDIMSLIKCYCESCSKLLPFHSCDWKQSKIRRGKVPVCPECPSQEEVVKQLDFLIACELSLEDEEGTPVAAIVSGEHAEKFFGCSVDELCLSEETKIRIRKFIHTHIEKHKSLVLKIILQKYPVSNRIRYAVLS